MWCGCRWEHVSRSNCWVPTCAIRLTPLPPLPPLPPLLQPHQYGVCVVCEVSIIVFYFWTVLSALHFVSVLKILEYYKYLLCDLASLNTPRERPYSTVQLHQRSLSMCGTKAVFCCFFFNFCCSSFKHRAMPRRRAVLTAFV